MRIPTRQRARQGNVVLILALSATVLFSFAALTIDLGYGRLVQQQLQNASEASARAGSLQLDSTDDGLDAARATAVTVAAANTAGGRSVALAEEDIVLGRWDEASGTFTVSDDPLLVNTVEVRARIDELGLFIAPAVFARNSMAVSGTTRAMAQSGGAGAVSCYMPLAVPDCIIEREGTDGMQTLTLRLNGPAADNVGWGRANGNINASFSKNQIDNCEAGGVASVGDPVSLQNGVVSSAVAAIVDRMNSPSSPTTWNAAKWGMLPTQDKKESRITRYGNTFEAPILVFDGGPEYCTGSGGSFNKNAPLKGFLWAAIYDVKYKGNATILQIRIDTSSDYNVGTKTGGPDYGVVSKLPPRMVRNF